MQTKCKKR